MSQVPNSKGKDAAKKYTSFNVNSTYKGSKGENKSATGPNTRHGLHILGKVSRRVPQPANLPSLKKENLGNNPRINLVPTRSQGWGKKESSTQGIKDAHYTTGHSVGPNKPMTSKRGDAADVSLRPNAGVVTTVKPPTSGSSEDHGKPTWVNKVQPQQTLPGTSTYFAREFPKLGGADGKGEDAKGKDRTEESGQDVNHQAMGHLPFMNGQKWMDIPSGSMPMPPHFPSGQYSGDRPPVFNGRQPFPYPHYPMYAGPGGRSMPMPPYPYPYPYPGSGGKMQFDPAFFQRMPKPPFMGPPTSQNENRPSVIKDSDFKSLDDDKDDDNGWAGAQEEVDYNAKLKFDESDDSDEESSKKSAESLEKNKPLSDDAKYDKEGTQNKQKPPEGWQGYEPGYPPMQVSYSQQNWARVPFPGYDLRRGLPPPGPHGYSFHPMYFMPPYGFPQNLPPQDNEKSEDEQNEKAEAGNAPVRLRAGDKKELERKAAAQSKLRELEEQMKRREAEEKHKREEAGKKQDGKDEMHDPHSWSRSRNNSEASDSSRRSMAKEIPPRFRRQMSGQHDNNFVSSTGDAIIAETRHSGSESLHLKIMKRKGSIKSDDDPAKDDLFKKSNTPVDKKDNSQYDRTVDGNNDHRSRQSSSSTLYQETVKSDRQKRYSSSSESHEKGKLSRQGSSNSVQSKEGGDQDKLHRKDFHDVSKSEKEHEKSKGRDKVDFYEKKNKTETKPSGTSRIDSQRFEELKLTKGQTKQSRPTKEELEQTTIHEKEKQLPKKPSAWSKVVIGEGDQSEASEVIKKSLREIQQEEEEEEENRKSGSKVGTKTQENVSSSDTFEIYGDKSSPDENKFRSDRYEKVQKKGDHDDKYEERYDRVKPERRGRFTDSSYRHTRGDRDGRVGNREFRKDKYRDDNRRDDGRGVDNREKDFRKEKYRDDNRRDDHHKRNDRRDESRREDGRDYYRKNERRHDHDYRKEDRQESVKKGDRRHEERKDDSATREKQEGTRKEDSKNVSKRDDSEEQTKKSYTKKDEKKEEQKGDVRKAGKRDESIGERRTRRDDRKSDRRKIDRREVGDRWDDKRENHKREDRRSEHKRLDDYSKDKRSYRKDEKRRDDDRKEYHNDREDVKRYEKRYEKRDSHDEKRYNSGRKRSDWSSRDYRQSEDYQKDVKQAQKCEQSKTVEDDGEGKKAMTLLTEKDVKKENVLDAEGEKLQETTKKDVLETKEGTISETRVDEIEEQSGEATKTRSFMDKSFTSKRDKYDNREHTGSYRERERFRSRGRGYPSRGGSYSSSKSQRPGSLSSYNRSYKSTDRGKDYQYGNISDGEFSDDEYESEKWKSPRKERKYDHIKSWETDKPPRFQQKHDGRNSYRGRGRGSRGSDRGRGADRGRGRGRGRGYNSSLSANRASGAASEGFDGKNEDDSEDFYSAEESTSPQALENEDSEKRRYNNNTFLREDRGKPRQKSVRGTYDGRGNPRSSRGGKSSSFLATRQQVGEIRASKDDDKALSAADKCESKTADVHIKYKPEQIVKSSSTLEEISEHSPPKKSKPLVEKKRDISREFDLSNIASVVCIDYINTDFDQSNKSKEEDGFVIVTSKKHQKELRDRQREEEKQKVILQQKRQAAATNKAQKAARKEIQKNAAQNAPKPVLPFTDAPISSATIEQVPASSAAVSTPAAQPIASNAAMAAFGAWEPAQSLMRTSQQNSSISNAEQTKTSLPSSINAWQRPLSLSTPVTSMPDPRAVGTGKPSSLHTVNKSSLIPTQPTPEAASPLVTPPALAPIGSSAMNTVSQVVVSEVETPAIQIEEKKEEFAKEKPKEAHVEARNEFSYGEKKSRDKSEGKREKPVNKRTMRDCPPRFQANSRKDTDDRNPYNESRKTNRQSTSGDNKSRKRSADRQRKTESSSKQSHVTKYERKKSIEKRHSQESDIVFTNDVPPTATMEAQAGSRKSVLSDADKVVGSNKPSLKPPQSSVGSYTASLDNAIEETVVEVNIQDSCQEPKKDTQIFSEEEEQNAKDTARSVIKSLNDDEERSLETRSLPGTPPLAVKIPEPTLSGPSSDPGRAPSPSVNKNLAPTLVHEMNEMNRRLLYARKAWDDTPTASNAPPAVTVAPMTAVSNASPPVVTEETTDPVSAKKSETTRSIVSASSEVLINPNEEKASVSGGTFSNKRNEQQNVCKVKPQQQLPPEDVKPFHQTHQITSSQREQVNLHKQKYTPYVMQVDRPLQQTALYASDYGEHLRSQTNPSLNFQSLNQVRSVDHSVSSLTQHQDLLLNMYSNPQLAWQVVSTPNVVRPAKTVAYQTHRQASLFTSPVSVNSTPLIMQHNGIISHNASNFSPQRTAGNLQRQSVGLMQVPQQQQSQAGRVVISTQPTPTQLRRDQHYQNLHATSQAHLGQMTLLLDPTTGLPPQQQITAQQRSDLMKHVHAKPFEPNSQTPPLMQSPPVVEHQSMPAMPQQHIISTVFSQPNSSHLPHSQNASRYSQPLIQQRQHSVQHLSQQQTPLVASVRPRSVQGPAIPAASPPLSIAANQDRMNMSTFDPNLAMIVNALALKNRGGGMQQIHVAQQSINAQFTHRNMHQQLQQQRGVPPNNRASTVQSRSSGGPGPIQRPSQQGHTPNPNPHQNKQSSTYGAPPNSSSGDFRKSQRQKMLEDTKRYFQENEKPKEEKPVIATPAANPNLSKHDKYILPDIPKENAKKLEYKKSQRNGSDHYRSRSSRRGDGGGNAKKFDNASSPQEHKRSATKT